MPRSSAGSAASPIKPRQHQQTREWQGLRAAPAAHWRERHPSPSTTANNRRQKDIFSFPNKGPSPVPCSQEGSTPPPHASALHTRVPWPQLRPRPHGNSPIATATAVLCPCCPPAQGKPREWSGMSTCACIHIAIIYIHKYINISILFSFKETNSHWPTDKSAPSQGMFVFIFFAVNEFCSWQRFKAGCIPYRS